MGGLLLLSPFPRKAMGIPPRLEAPPSLFWRQSFSVENLWANDQNDQNGKGQFGDDFIYMIPPILSIKFTELGHRL